MARTAVMVAALLAAAGTLGSPAPWREGVPLAAEGSRAPHGLASGPSGAAHPLAAGVGRAGGPYEIWEIQGEGLASPYAGQVVATHDAIVTAVGPQGFFIQTPDARSDSSAQTSNGIYVHTGTPPAVAVGDQVDVVGLVQEFYDFTEIAGSPVVQVDSHGNPLPAAVVFDASLPSPHQPQDATAYERFEGMRILVASGVVAGPSQFFRGDPTAEAFVVAGPSRPYREPGIRYPGLPGLPVWDGNPEVFELDADKFAERDDPLDAGASFSAEGVLGFEFGGWELWPTHLTLHPAPLPVPVRPRAPGEFTVGSLNVLRLYDDVDDPGPADDGNGATTAEYARRLRKLSRYIREVLDAPDVLALQEVEHLGVLHDLAGQLRSDDPLLLYTAYLAEGNDSSGMDVGFLVRDSMAVDGVTQLGASERFSWDGSPLHDRPPLLLEARYTGNGVPFPLRVLVLHNRSLLGIDTPSDGPRVRQKRLEQAQSVAAMIQQLQEADAQVRLVVVGDFNAFEVTDGYVDVTGQIKGEVVPSDNLLSGPDLVNPDLVDEVLHLPPSQRYSTVENGTAQVLDHALWSQGLAAFVRGMAYGRGNADAAEVRFFDDSTPLRSSDHDGLVLYLMSDADGDGTPDDAPQFATTSNAAGVASGTVSDASGIVSVELAAGSRNVALTTSGHPGDPSWEWRVALLFEVVPGTAVLQARDSEGRTAAFRVTVDRGQTNRALPPAGRMARNLFP